MKQTIRPVKKRNSRATQEVPPWLGAALVGGTFVTLLWLEQRRPLRPERHEPKLRRNARNLAVAVLAAAAV